MLTAWRKRATQEGEYSDARSNPYHAASEHKI
ncbi:hypothetical protein AB2F45_11290 [Escherichia coli]